MLRCTKWQTSFEVQHLNRLFRELLEVQLPSLFGSKMAEVEDQQEEEEDAQEPVVQRESFVLFPWRVTNTHSVDFIYIKKETNTHT